MTATRSDPPLVSVLTPSWNRAHLLPRVHAALAAQTDPRFEWVVGDDGSDDGTEDLVAHLASTSSFPVTYIRADARVGKTRIDNAAVQATRGMLALWCDSDDYLVPTAVADLLAAWESIDPAERDAFVGVTALAATEHGVIADPLPGGDGTDVRWNALTERHGFDADAVYMIRTDMLRAHPFPEVDLVIPEGVIWAQLGEMKARYTATIVKIVEYRAANAISFSGVMAYNRGRAHALALTERQLRQYQRPPRTQRWRLLTFLRYGLLGEIGLAKLRALWGDNPAAALFWPMVPVAAALAARDLLRGKVVRSHRLFEQNRHAPLTVRRLIGRGEKEALI